MEHKSEEVPTEGTVSVKEKREIESIPEPSEEEKRLEKLVFGDKEGFENNLRKVDNLFDEEREEDAGGQNLYVSDSESEDEYLSGIQNKDETFLNDKDGENKEEGDGIADDMSKLRDDQLFLDDENDEDADNGSKMDVDNESDNETSDSDSYMDSDSDSSTTSDAWTDSDDEKITISVASHKRLRKLRVNEEEDKMKGKQYCKRLRAQFERIFPRPEWADRYESDNDESKKQQTDNEDEDYGDEVGSSARTTTVSGSSNSLLDFLRTNQTYKLKNENLRLLSPGKIDIVRLTDANIKKISHSAVQALCFHHTHPLLLTGGYDRTLRVFHIDGQRNNLVTSIHLRNSPVQSAAFGIGDTTEIFAGGRRRYMYKWNVNAGVVEKITRLYGHEQTQRSFENFKLSPDGRYIGLIGSSGWVNLLSSTTGQWIRGFKIEGTLIDFDFSQNSTKSNAKNKPFLVAINTAGEIWEFEVESGKTIARWTDDTGVGITKVALGGYNGNNRWIAVGSKSGIVNIYDRFKNNKLLGVVESLVTSISGITFNADGQLLCVASRAKKDALRLVHIPTCKVYKNWPTSGTPLGKVTSVCFSPNSEMLATGNEAGKVRLWRLNHY